MSFSPVSASKKITEKYIRYLKTYFGMGEPYKREFENLLERGDKFASGPFLDVTDAFEKGKSISQLIEEGVLPADFSKINMNQTRPLYKHQEKALRKIATEKRNLVVSTGTGSGKTESFMIPILRELVTEAENNTLCPGVRALLIYPMNALANDQTERLRDILKDFPQITFGTYTGQTMQKYEDALKEYKSLNDDHLPIVNELISREQMINTPPHILITNYAMLEYLMIRPNESEFFVGKSAKNWKFIVFDEAHVYNGSTGIEVSMLFRRLKSKLQKKELTYILTSATLGEKENDDQVAEFAQKLCNAPFSENDIIRAYRIIPKKEQELSLLPLSFYKEIANAIETENSEEEISRILGCPTTDINAVLYEKLAHDVNYWNIRRILETPKSVAEIASAMSWTEQQLADFVSVASMAEKDGGKLFDARYHMFLRATESVFVTLEPDNRVMLNRTDVFRSNETETGFKVFEVATCAYCSSIYLVGKIENNKLVQCNRSDELSEKAMFLLSSSISDTDSDNSLEDEGIEACPYEICPYCGFLHKVGEKSHCEHNSADYVKVFRVELSNKSRTLTKCLKCENVNYSGVARMFFSGQEAATSVIGTALFEELPSYRIILDDKKNEKNDDEFEDFEDLDDNSKGANKEQIAKQFIAFSDSRQAAAFYASYLNISYNNILYRRLIVETLKKINKNEGKPIPSFVDLLKMEFQRYGIEGKSDFSENSNSDSSKNDSSKEAWKAVLSELVDNSGSSSLFKFGFLGVAVDVKTGYPKYKLSPEEFNSLVSVFIVSMMTNAAIMTEEYVHNDDLADITHNGKTYGFSVSDSSPKEGIKSFIPTKSGMSNKRIDYFQKVLQKKGFIIDNDECAEILKKIYDLLLRKNFLVKRKNQQRSSKESQQVNLEKVNVILPEKVYICKKCKKVTCLNVENVCPAYHCDGELAAFDPTETFADNHYYKLYSEMEIRDLRVVEHTAQLDKSTAYDYQKKFKKKHIDVLSCSTTFEMGVDVGSLETVFMRNMPPLPSNYAQRAGRAGRSSKAAAFALTFCNKSSHDFSYFNDPVRMIKGKIDPPKYNVENDRIAIRHLYAASLGMFWKLHPELFTKIGDFLKNDNTGMNGIDHLKVYLNSKPEDLKDYLNSFLPSVLSEKYGVDTFEWIDGFVGDDGVLTNAIIEYQHEVSVLEELKKERYSQCKPTDSISNRLNAYYSENILTFMSRKNIIPKYGFPVDTVEMSVVDTKRSAPLGLQLQRDLSMAISEYAPGSQVIANNRLITSRYIKKIPSIGWKMYNYHHCNVCKTLTIKQYTDDENSKINECCQCHNPFSDTPKVFLIPAQGFAADGSEIKKPGLKKPEKTYRGEIYYVGFNDEVEKKHYNIGNSEIVLMTSHNDEMAVLNTSNFYVCEKCGYTDLDEEQYTVFKKKKHISVSGRSCGNEVLKRFSLGYRFLTDVVRIHFENIAIDEFDKGLSILHGLLHGICSYLNIEESDISGCLQSNPKKGKINYSIVIFDNTPGGSGHAKRLDDPVVIEKVMRHTLKLMKGCVCGGDEGDSSCYSCLRNYKNQKYHDLLRRKYVIDFLSEILNNGN